ncbi:reverse transcriptase domain-containing protein [Tanacetum coccineum]
MKGIEMSKQERESMLYDEFDKFTFEPGESIHSYYLRYAKLINDMKMNPMSMSNMQINTKFVYAFLKHNEKDAKEVREMRQRFSKPLALLANTYNPPPSYNSQQIHYAPIVVQQSPTSQPDTRFVAPTFLPIDDPIANLNNYWNVQGRQSQGYAGNARKNQASGARVVNIVRNARAYQPRVIICYNCNGEGYIAKQCTAKKRVKDSECFKDKMLLSLAQEAGFVLNDEQHHFLADSLEETDDCDDL